MKKITKVHSSKLNLRSKNVISAGIITSTIVLSLFTGYGIFLTSRDKMSTCYYHFNIQYKAGQIETYDEIIQSMAHVIYMYGRHSDWKYTIETQFMTIEYMLDHAPAVFRELRRQNYIGQLELIINQYSDGWHIDQPLKNFKDSVNYTAYRMEELELRPSRLILLQEGQWIPGFVELENIGNFDVYLVHREQFGYFNYYPEEPVLEWTYNGKTKHVMVNPRMPRIEAGVYHYQIYAADGELINTGDVEIDVGAAERFQYNAEKQHNHEKHLEQLERLGNKFVTMEEFYDYCIEKGAVGTLDKFIPECEWVPNQYRQFFNWMGDGRGNVDDGYYRARVYNARNVIQAAELLLNDARSQGLVNHSEYDRLGMNRVNGVDGTLLEASKKIWESQVSDATGISPIFLEFWYGMNRTYEALQLATSVIQEIRAINGSQNPYYSGVQVNPWINAVSNTTSTFQNNTLIEPVSLTDILTEFDIGITVSQSEVYRTYGFLEQYERYNYTAVDWNQEYYKLTYNFRSRYNINHTHDNNDYLSEEDLSNHETDPEIEERNDIHVIFEDLWPDAVYSPALMENYTQPLSRADFYQNVEGIDYEFVCLLALSNGMIYNPAKGYAIIKNTTSHNIAAFWREEGVDFYEESTQYNSEREYFLVKGSLEEALRFANQINSYQAITLGGMA